MILSLASFTTLATLSSVTMTNASTVYKIQWLNPNVSYSNSVKIANAALKCEKKSGVGINTILGLIYTESSFKINAYNEYSNDYGLTQVNHWHVRRSGLDKERLLRDVDYNVKHGCGILTYFKNRYGQSENKNEFLARFNCGTRKGCYKWKPVKRYVAKIRRTEKIIKVFD